jgi:hypothetical protein
MLCIRTKKKEKSRGISYDKNQSLNKDSFKISKGIRSIQLVTYYCFQVHSLPSAYLKLKPCLHSIEQKKFQAKVLRNCNMSFFGVAMRSFVSMNADILDISNILDISHTTDIFDIS